MKTLINILILALLIGSTSLSAQNRSDDYLGLPGDNLNLFAVMKIFQESETLEAFERNLNDPEALINNLDLNGDRLVDYIMVFDYVEGDVHNIVLRVALNQREFQDVAVFTVERQRNGAVIVQLIGDEALYGPNYIVEPMYAETPNPGYRQNAGRQQAAHVGVTYYEVANWPVIVYIYRPSYTIWRSSWYWGYYPSYWNPWEPHYWHYYHGYHYHWHSHYYTYYRPWRTHRSNHYHNVYYSRIRNHSNTVVVNINNGRYNDTYSRPERKHDGEKYFERKHPNRKDEMTRERNRNDQNVNNTATRPRRENNDQSVGNSTRPKNETREGRGSTDKRVEEKSVDRNKRETGVTSNPPVRNEARTRPTTQPPQQNQSVNSSRERPSTTTKPAEKPSTNRERPAPEKKPSTPERKPESSKSNESSTQEKNSNERKR
jgi:hypothetical protein